MCLRCTNLCKTHFYVDFNFLFEIMVNVGITNDNVFKLIESHTNFISKHSLNANYTNFSWLKFHLPVFSISWILQLVYTKYIQPEFGTIGQTVLQPCTLVKSMFCWANGAGTLHINLVCCRWTCVVLSTLESILWT